METRPKLIDDHGKTAFIWTEIIVGAFIGRNAIPPRIWRRLRGYYKRGGTNFLKYYRTEQKALRALSQVNDRLRRQRQSISPKSDGVLTNSTV
jgi:hypothetical protein